MVKKSISNNDKKAIFESERCYTRRFAESDLDGFVAYRNNTNWMKFQYFKGLSREEYKEILLKEQLVESGAQFAIIRKADQTLIGDVYLKKKDDTFWIGYTVSPAYKRQGYAYEITHSMILWLKQQGEFQIKASVLPGNVSSVRLLEKLGFSQLDEEEGEFIFSFFEGPVTRNTKE